MQELTDANFDGFVKANGKVIVDFWAAWCAPCRLASPVFDELSKEFKGKLVFAKLDTEANPETPQKFGIMSIPAFLVFDDGEMVGEFFGAMPKEMFREEIKKFV